MNLPQYVTQEEVQRVCRELGLRDWSKLTDTEVLPEEARILQKEVGGEALQVSPDAFCQALEVELEHGITFPDADVTGNHPILTAKIVLAHLKEMLDYYSRLEVAELEGDMLKASRAGNAPKLADKYRQWVTARDALSRNEVNEEAEG